MSSMTHEIPSGGEPPDLSLPDPRREMRRASRPVRLIGALAGALGVGLVAVAYLVAAPFIALGTGAMQIVMEIRENAVRPRPFVGSAHGFPFLDPPDPAPVIPETVEED